MALQRLQEPGTGVAVAASMGVSESTVSRIKTGHLEEVALFLACLGLKVVPAEAVCINPSTYQFLTLTHERVLRAAPHLIWEADG